MWSVGIDETYYVNTNLDFRIASSLSVPNVEKKIYISLFGGDSRRLYIYSLCVCVCVREERPIEERDPRCQRFSRVVIVLSLWFKGKIFH